MDATWLDTITGSAWLLPALFGLVVLDAFLVIVPSEVSVVALGALWAATGSPPILAVAAVAAVGAIVGDTACFWIGRRVGTDRWRWQRGRRMAAAIERVSGVIRARTATLVFTARYIPFARIAVNLTAGASGVPYRGFLPLSAAAGATWAAWNLAVGALGGTLLGEQPVLAVVVSIIVAMGVGVLIDVIVSRRARRRAGAPDDATR
jgi:membrane protein DedA with SNARE-associated domain